MTASNVGVQDTGPEIVLWQEVEVVVVEVVVHFLHILGLELLVVDMGIALVVSGIDMWTTVMMEDAMEIGIVLTTVTTTNMAAVIAIAVTGIQAVEIDLLAIDMAVGQIITHKMVMGRKEGMTDTVVHEAVLIGMEVE